MNEVSVLTEMPLFASVRRRIVIGIGEYAVSGDADALIVTHALGSCVAVCVWDPTARVGGMVHVLLPDSKINPARAEVQPGAFADTGIPLLFHAAYQKGAKKGRCRVHLVGGATISGAPSVEPSLASAMCWLRGPCCGATACWWRRKWLAETPRATWRSTCPMVACN